MLHSRELPESCPVNLEGMLKGWQEEDLTSLYQLVMVNKTRIKRQSLAQSYGAFPEYKTDATLDYMLFDTIRTPHKEGLLQDKVSYAAGVLTVHYMYQVLQEGEEILLNIANDTQLDLLIRGIAIVRLREGLGPKPKE